MVSITAGFLVVGSEALAISDIVRMTSYQNRQRAVAQQTTHSTHIYLRGREHPMLSSEDLKSILDCLASNCQAVDGYCGEAKPILAKSLTLQVPTKLSTSVQDIGLTLRAQNPLLKAGIATVERLVSWRSSDLLKLPNFGPDALAQVIRSLNELGLTLNG